jgi:hypothetical protein
MNAIRREHRRCSSFTQLASTTPGTITSSITASILRTCRRFPLLLVNLDPHHPQGAYRSAALGIRPAGRRCDRIAATWSPERNSRWQGKIHQHALDPDDRPYAVWPSTIRRRLGWRCHRGSEGQSIAPRLTGTRTRSSTSSMSRRFRRQQRRHGRLRRADAKLDYIATSAQRDLAAAVLSIALARRRLRHRRLRGDPSELRHDERLPALRARGA